MGVPAQGASCTAPSPKRGGKGRTSPGLSGPLELARVVARDISAPNTGPAGPFTGPNRRHMDRSLGPRPDTILKYSQCCGRSIAATLVAEGCTVRIGVGDDLVFELVRSVGDARLVRLALFYSVADVGYRQHVTGAYSPRRDPSAVDPGSIGAAKVAHVHFACDRGQAAVPP
jgi:hypothetical protein